VNSLRLILNTVLAVVILATLATSGGFQLNEHGSRAMAMGGAWAARAYDGSAIFFNPAGLAFQSGTHVYLGTTLITPSATFYGPVVSGFPSGQEWKMESQTFTPINVYATTALTEDIVVGIGVYNPYGLGTEWPDKWAGSLITEKVDLQTFYITPTVSYKISDDLSIGVGFNFVTGTAKISRYTDNFNPPGQVAIEASGTGYGFNVGLMYKVTKELSVGATYRSSTKISPTGTATFTPNRSVYPAGDVETELELPSTAFLGVAYKVMDNLEIEADYQYIGWSSYKELAFTFKKDGSRVASAKDYENTYILRAGAEYTMGDLQVRVGYLFDNNPVPDKKVEPLLPDANRNGLNLGFGYKLTESIHLDMSYLYLKFDERKAVNTDVGFDGIYQSDAHLIGFNIGYSF
jgi:long-chain fatty acid transport protein